MSYNQQRDANMTVGYVGGMCLKYVQDAFGTDHPYPTALSAWNANVGASNHPGELPPMGLTVPVYFSLGTVPAGHVAIRLSDGYVASSSLPGSHPAPFYYKTIQDLIADYAKYNGGCTYLGWSEYVGTVRVVQDIELATTDQIQQAYQELLGRPADQDGLSHYARYTLDFVRQDLAGSAEHRAYMLAQQAAADAARRAAEEAAAALKRQQEEAAAHVTVNVETQPAATLSTTPTPSPIATSAPVAAATMTKPETPNPIVRFLFELYIRLFGKK